MTLFLPRKYHEFRARVASQFDKTDTTLANITGLSIDLLVGRTYRFKAVLFVNADATGGHKYAIGGTCTATAIIAEILSIRDSTMLPTITTRVTAFGSSAGEASGTAYITIVEGTITVNAAGTLTIQFAQNAANGTSSVLVGSTLSVEDVN
jgi:hypothetical protein